MSDTKTRGKISIDLDPDDVVRARHVVAIKFGGAIKISCHAPTGKLAWSSDTLDEEQVEACIQFAIKAIRSEEMHVHELTDDNSRAPHYRSCVALFQFAPDRMMVVEKIVARMSGKVTPVVPGIENRTVRAREFVTDDGLTVKAVKFWLHVPSTGIKTSARELIESLLNKA